MQSLETLGRMTSTDKVMEFFKKNIYNMILIVVSAIFILKDLIIWEVGKKPIELIIADGLISFIMGMTFNIILGKKGILAGQSTPEYIDTMMAYAKQIERTDDKCDKLDGWCDSKNSARVKRVQTRILSKARIRFEDFENNDKSHILDKEQRKAWRHACHVKIHLLSADNLLSETDTRYEKGEKEYTISEYERSKNFKDASTKVMFAVVFGYFGYAGLTGEWAGVLWGAFQVSIWLILGLMSYIQNYTFIKDTYRQKIIRKTAYLTEFNNTVKGGK
jgi:hypothetical protein